MRLASLLLAAIGFASGALLAACSSLATDTPGPSATGDAAAPPPPSEPPSQDASTVHDAEAASDAPSPRPEAGASGAIHGWPPAGAPPIAPPYFGPNVVVLDPSMSASDVQSKIDAIANKQNARTDQSPVGFGYGAEFSTSRYAIFFKPGMYQADIRVGYYMHVAGLGHAPDDVTITGAVRSKADWRTDDPGNALLNFWREAENFAVVPTLDGNTNVWGVSQATHLRRAHIKGPLALSDGGWSSGGFIADSKIDSTINSGTQQQFLTRNTDVTNWQGAAWNMVFVGDEHAPAASWPSPPYTVVDETPSVREKPFLFVEPNGSYYVMVPALKQASHGTDWSTDAAPGDSVPIDHFYVAHADTDTAMTINAALGTGKHLIVTPGIYHLAEAIHVTKAGTVVLGLGFPTLIPDHATPALQVDDVDGVTVAEVLFDAGPTSSPTLLQIGAARGGADHSANPTALFDVHCRVGGATPGTAASCTTLNSNDVLVDHTWLWRSDDGAGVGWDQNKSDHGLVVNGDRVAIYGLFVEHFQQYQTLWNGEKGTVYFYQSEMPYDPPAQSSWMHGSVNGYASYKIDDAVTTHDARGIGVYCVFDSVLVSDNAVETPAAGGDSVKHIVTLRFGGAAGSGIRHILNGTGDPVDEGHMSAHSTD